MCLAKREKKKDRDEANSLKVIRYDERMHLKRNKVASLIKVLAFDHPSYQFLAGFFAILLPNLVQ